MDTESNKQSGGFFARLGKFYAAADAARDKAVNALGLKNWASVTEKTFGAEAARLETQSRAALKDGHLGKAASLGVESIGHGLVDVAQKGAMKRVGGGVDVITHGSAPATPPKPVAQDKGAPKR